MNNKLILTNLPMVEEMIIDSETFKNTKEIRRDKLDLPLFPFRLKFKGTFHNLEILDLRNLDKDHIDEYLDKKQFPKVHTLLLENSYCKGFK